MCTSSVGDNIAEHIIEINDSVRFYNALNKAKGKNPFGAYVTLHETYEYDSCKKLFVFDDDTAGIAVKEDGNIISVFSDQTHRNVLRYLLDKAVNAGGIKLDCFGSEGLRYLYMTRGFIPVTRTKFEKEFAPEDWNYARDHEPDILFFIYDTNHDSPIRDYKISEDFDIMDIPCYDTYEIAEAERDKLLTK